MTADTGRIWDRDATMRALADHFNTDPHCPPTATFTRWLAMLSSVLHRRGLTVGVGRAASWDRSDIIASLAVREPSWDAARAEGFLDAVLIDINTQGLVITAWTPCRLGSRHTGCKQAPEYTHRTDMNVRPSRSPRTEWS